MTNEDFLDKLIEYCTDKPHRGKYLKELKNLGVFIEDNDPQLITRNYLVNHPDICEEGRDRFNRNAPRTSLCLCGDSS